MTHNTIIGVYTYSFQTKFPYPFLDFERLEFQPLKIKCDYSSHFTSLGRKICVLLDRIHETLAVKLDSKAPYYLYVILRKRSSKEGVLKEFKKLINQEEWDEVLPQKELDNT